MSKNYDKYLNLTSQRAQSFQKIKAQLEELSTKVLEAGTANKKESLEDSPVDIANKWSKIMVGNARMKGHKAGYAEACSHMVGLIGSLMSFIDEELSELQGLYDEILESDTGDTVEEDDADSSSEDTPDPLG